MKTMIKLSFVLAAYASVACVGLAFVYNLTAPYIAEAAANEVKAGLRTVFPDATDFEDVTGKVSSGVDGIVFERAYVAKTGSAVSGMVIQATGPTYKNSTVLVAVNMARAITAVRFTANNDTPGLGTKTAESPFIDQFAGKGIDDAFKAGSDVQAISGATISSKAVARILKVAGIASGEYLSKNFGAPEGTGSGAVIASGSPMSVEDALRAIFPGADFEDVTGKVVNDIEGSIAISGAWLARKDGKPVGVAVKARGQTYKASTLVVGANVSRAIAGIRVNETEDSKNYGYAMVEPDYLASFEGKSVDDPWLVTTPDRPGDVDAISGATISTMGFANIAKVASLAGAEWLAGKGFGKSGPAKKASVVINEIPEEE